MAEPPLVSCLCVTRNRVPLLRRAVNCFLLQTYRPRELVVLYVADDAATGDYLRSLNEPSIRAVEVAAAAALPLGLLRNLSIQAAHGAYVAQWDDDDWHAPTRLTDQMRAIAQFGRPGCALLRLTIFDMKTGKAYLSAQRAWEGSLVTERSAITPYAELDRLEDTPVLASMLAEDKLALLDHPYLYIYVYHGGNVCDRGHWEDPMRAAQLLSPEMSARVGMVLGLGEAARRGEIAVDAGADGL